MKVIEACAVAASVAGGTLALCAGSADAQGFGPLPATPFSLAVSVTAAAPPSAGVSSELAVFTSEGIPPARAQQALQLQRAVAETHLVANIKAVLGPNYAGVWFEPAAARFHIGVTSSASEQVAAAVVADAGLAHQVIETPVRSTWSALIAAQSHWGATHAKLLAAGEARSGIDVPHNAVAVEVSSSLPASERAQLQSEAAVASVTVSVDAISPKRLGFVRKAAKTCTSPFVEKAAYCEETLTSGVRLEEAGCTAGPLLISGNETYVLTAGHCFTKEEPAGAQPITTLVSSKYPGGAEKKEVGKEGTYYRNNERDMAEIKISAGSPFKQALPTPVPALMAEWAKEPKTPHAVEGVQAAEEVVPAQAICHEGQASGEKCGSVGKVNVERVKTKHLVEVTACGSVGDSGGSYFFRTAAGGILMMGTEVGGPEPECPNPGPYESFFEPLVGIPGFEAFGILNTFAGQRLLTTGTENRTKNEEAEKVGPYWTVGGTRLVAGKTHNFDARATASFVLTNTLATVAVTCTGLGTENGVLLGSNSGTGGTGSQVIVFSGCTMTGNGSACHLSETEGGATTTTVIRTNPIRSEQVESVSGSKAGPKLLQELVPATASAGFVTLNFGGTCTVNSTIVSGSVVAEVLLDTGGQGNIELGQAPQERTGWLLRFPATPITSVWLISAGTGKTVKTGATAFGEAAVQTGTALLLLASSKFTPEPGALWSPLP